MFQGSVLEDGAKVNQFGVKVRGSATCSLALASVDANDKKTLEKIALVSDKIQDGALLLGVWSLQQGLSCNLQIKNNHCNR